VKVRLVEEYDPIKDTTIYFSQRQFLGLWFGIFSVIDSSITHRKDEAYERWERIKKHRSTSKVRTVIDEATL
jgi:hypothetical protein